MLVSGQAIKILLGKDLLTNIDKRPKEEFVKLFDAIKYN